MYILVIITSIKILSTPHKPAFCTKNKNGESLKRSLEDVTCFIVDLTTSHDQ